ncbi:AMP-binding protein [Amycolatopsis sp. cg9]|uniref:amino acid adenylation domain-containing protein n=1 Tax=Amycolatopsis sp. cg9 TaxID=3238801 RepID=UPI00352607D5
MTRHTIATEADLPAATADVTVLDRWQDAAEPRGGRTALRDNDMTRDHAEVREIALRRAAHLLRGGLRAEDRLAVVLGSGVEQATWLAAAVLAGGCAVPIGLNQPESRLRTLVDLARPRLVITDRDTRRLAGRHESLDGGFPGIAGPADLPRPGPAQAAYICFTSGTTGRPKGVVVTHEALAHTSGRIAAHLGLDARPRTHVLAASWSFDVAMMDLWLALTTGGTLFVPGRDALLGSALPLTLSGAEAPVLHTVPSLFASVSEADLRGLPPDTTIMTGGEPVPTATLRLLASAYDVRVVYGITETAVISTIARADPGTRPESVGRPLSGVDCEVVDAALRAVPDGTLGELLIGGPVVARGYLGDPVGTAPRFVPRDGGDRWYRSGDLVRRHPDGALTFHGRVDHQVKIRGHRVEPAEVEAVLLGVPGVREAAVVVRDDPSGAPALVAHLAGDGLDVATIRRESSARLPGWMVPRVIAVQPALPLGATGKVDRRALPEPVWDAAAPVAGGSGPGAAAMSKTERAVGRLWQQVLGTGEVTGEANFVDLGGHSLKAAQLSTALQDALGVAVPVPDVLAASNLRELSQEIERLRDASAPSGPAPGEVRQAVSSATRLLWLHQTLIGDVGVYNLVVAVRVRGPVRPTALQRALRLAEQTHPALRTWYEFDGDAVVAVEAPPSNRPLAVRSGSAEQAVRDAGRVALGTGGRPVWTYELFTEEPGESVLLLAFHHVAVDGVALHELLRWIAAAYSATVRPGGEMPRFPARDTASSAGNPDAAFWAEMFRQAPAPALLPGQRTEGEITDVAGWCRPVALAGISASRLRRLAAARGATVQAAVLSAFVRTLARVTDQSDVTVGVALTRRGVDVSHEAVGQFVSVLPVRFRLPADLDAVGCLEVAVRTVHDAQRHCATDPQAVLTAARTGQVRWAAQPFHVNFSWEDDLAPLDFEGCETTWSVEFNGWSDAELTFDLMRRGDDVVGRVVGRQATTAEVRTEAFLADLTRCLHELMDDLARERRHDG